MKACLSTSHSLDRKAEDPEEQSFAERRHGLDSERTEYTGMYQPRDYWQNRLRQSLDLEGVGCIGMGQQYNAYLYRAKVRALERGLHRLGIRDLQKKSVLDLGAGTGFWVSFFLDQGVSTCVGVDIADVAIDYLVAKFPTDRTAFFRSDISSPDLPAVVGRQFDIVTAFDVLYHIVDDELLRRAIKNVSCLVTDMQGWFIFTDSTGVSEGQMLKQAHVRPRSRSYWQHVLADEGFQIRAEVPMYVFLHAAVSGHPLLKSCVNFIHYHLTRRFADKPLLGKLFLSVLSTVDDLCTTIGGTSLHMVFAEKAPV